ncbi:MAG: hypothetical protein MJ202_08865 [Lentisphaeria bacterium]|nr:hypothetical protein [Lentisphaeria bacterium]
MRLLLEHGASLEKKTYLDDTYQKHFHEGFRLLLEHGAEKEEKELVYSILQHYSFTPNWEEQKQYFKEILAKFTPEELSPFTFPRRKDLPATTFPNYVLSISDRDTSPAQKHEVLLLLKEKGIPIIAPQKEKYTSLFYSLLKDFSNESPCLNTRMEKLLDFLIAQGEDVNCAAFPKEDSEGNTKLEMTGILTYMAREKYKTPGLVGYFLDHGARTDIKDETGKTCMDYLAELEDKSAWQALYAPEEFQKARELYRTKIYVEFHNVEEFFANPSYRHDPVQIASEGLKDDQLALSFPYWLDKFRASVLSREKDSRDTYTLEYAIYQPLYFHASIHVIRLPESAETDSWEKVVQEQWQNRQKDLEKKSSILEIEDLQFSPLSAPKKLAKSGIQYKENEASFVKLDWYNSNCARATLLKKHYFYTLHHGNVLEIEVFAREKKACLQLEEVWELFLQTIDSQLFAKSAIQQ